MFEIQSINIEQGGGYEVKMHPKIPMQILQYYERRNQQMDVVGTLIGIVHPNFVELSNCYQVPFSVKVTENKENNKDPKQDYEIQIDKELHNNQFEALQKFYQKEIIVGFFIAQPQIDYKVIWLNKYYMSKFSQFIPQGLLSSPIIVTFDPQLTNGKLDFQVIKYAHYSIDNSGTNDFCIFDPLILKIEYNKEQRCEVALSIRQEKNVEKEYNTLNPNFSFYSYTNLGQLKQELLENLYQINQYISLVKVIQINLKFMTIQQQQGKIKGDIKIGQQIQQLLNIFPFGKATNEQNNQEIEQYINAVQLQHLLSQIVNTQLTIAEKLNKI